MTVMEILVRVKDAAAGAMVPFMLSQSPADRQIKIRGPFGCAIYNPQVRVPSIASSHANEWVNERVVFIAAGSGITPFLQILNTLLLPTDQHVRVCTNYQPVLADELHIVPGDRVEILHHYYDGWAYGKCLRTGIEGAFPLAATLPFCGSRPRLTLINCTRSREDIGGLSLLEGTLLSYPFSLEVHHFVSEEGAPSAGISGMVEDLHPRLEPWHPGPDKTPLNRSSRDGYIVSSDSHHIQDSSLSDSKQSELPGPSTSSSAEMAPGKMTYHAGRLTVSALKKLLRPVVGPMWSESAYTCKKVFVCGPRTFAGSLVDALTEMGLGNDVRVLPDDHWIEYV